MKTATKKKETKPEAPVIKTTRAVLVCTEFRAVLYGQSDSPLDAITATLSGFRNCLFWEKAVGGVFGLAEHGPSAGCKIGAKITGPSTFQKVTCMIEVTEAAAKAWEAAPSVS